MLKTFIPQVDANPVAATVVVALLFVCLGSQALASGDVEKGSVIYTRECAVCHGATGGGDGPASRWFDPKPRDFGKGMYKFRSTENGELPTDADLARTVRNGLGGTGMPAFKQLGDADISNVVAFVKTLGRPKGEEESWFDLYEVPPPIDVTSPPAFDAATVARGKELYVSMGCNTCHGKTGRGDGKRPEEMLDDWGNPLVPRDFSFGLYKGGGRPEDLYTRVMTGLNGTPMTGYWKDAMTPDERWAIVAFVLSLGTPRTVEQPSRAHLELSEATLPAGLDDAKWKEVAASELLRMPLSGGWLGYFGPVETKGASANGELALLLAWEDDENTCPSIRVSLGRQSSGAVFDLGTKDRLARVWEWKEGEDVRALDSAAGEVDRAVAETIVVASRANGKKRSLYLRGPAEHGFEEMAILIGGCTPKGTYLTASAVASLHRASASP